MVSAHVSAAGGRYVIPDEAFHRCRRSCAPMYFPKSWRSGGVGQGSDRGTWSRCWAFLPWPVGRSQGIALRDPAVREYGSVGSFRVQDQEQDHQDPASHVDFACFLIKKERKFPKPVYEMV